ncbi:MAG: Multidrug resistance protein MdtH [Anaerolineales bacterium]|nr:Multidrug resistance protein MdtH [Anaerolineales bacterium]
MIARLNTVYRYYPRLFWVVVGISFVDRVGGTILFPFFALYITEKFNIGMTQAGLLLGIMSLFGLFSNMAGGALTDRMGRKSLILFGLIFSALSSLVFGLINDLPWMYPLVVVVGLIGSISHPAHDAMVADILPEDKRQEGFGILRVSGNLAWLIGPAIGGFVAKNLDFFYLFVIDAVISCMVAALFFRMLPETRPQAQAGAESHPVVHESITQTLRGYMIVFRDLGFVAFVFANMLMLLVYQQMYGTLSVYLRDEHGVDPQIYGILMMSSAITVILFQLAVSRWLRDKHQFLMMGFGTLFFMVGFSMIGFIAAYWLFAVALVIITIGEMIVFPVSQGLAANFAPEAMRGRYMAFFGLSWAIPSVVGQLAAGYILDYMNPNLVWYLGGILSAVSAASYYTLHLRLHKQKRFARRAIEDATDG